jgi:hypothetical protein
VVDRLRAAVQDMALRDLVESLVASAVVVESWPERRSTWARMEVMWTDDVQSLLDAEELTLDRPPARPELSPMGRAAACAAAAVLRGTPRA